MALKPNSWIGVGLYYSPELPKEWEGRCEDTHKPYTERCTLEFTPVDKRVFALCLKDMEGETLTIVCAYAPNSSSEYSVFLETLNGVLHRAPVGHSIVPLRDFNIYVFNDGDT